MSTVKPHMHIPRRVEAMAKHERNGQKKEYGKCFTYY